MEGNIGWVAVFLLENCLSVSNVGLTASELDTITTVGL